MVIWALSVVVMLYNLEYFINSVFRNYYGFAIHGPNVHIFISLLQSLLVVTPLMFDVLEIRKEFPILAKKVNNKPLVYLDNGASSQKPISVIETIKNCYENEYSNVHRGLHFLSNLATEKFEAVREN